MLKITLINKFYLIGRVEEVLEVIEELLNKYGKEAKLIDIINDCLND